MYYPKNKIIFPHIPKTGGSSLEYFIGQIEHPGLFEKRYKNEKNHMKFLNDLYRKYTLEEQGKRARIHRRALSYKNHLGDSYDDYYSFSILRNPFSQIKSLYTMTKTDMEGRGKGHLIPEWEDYIMSDEGNGIKRLKGFLDYVFLLTDKSREYIVDELFPFEYYEDVVNILAKKFNFTPDFGVRLWSTKPKYEYTPDMVERVMDLYGDSYHLWKQVKKHWEKTNKPYAARKKNSTGTTGKA